MMPETSIISILFISTWRWIISIKITSIRWKVFSRTITKWCFNSTSNSKRNLLQILKKRWLRSYNPWKTKRRINYPTLFIYFKMIWRKRPFKRLILKIFPIYCLSLSISNKETMCMKSTDPLIFLFLRIKGLRLKPKRAISDKLWNPWISIIMILIILNGKRKKITENIFAIYIPNEFILYWYTWYKIMFLFLIYLMYSL